MLILTVKNINPNRFLERSGTLMIIYLVDIDGLNSTLSSVDWNDVFDATPFDIDVIYQRFFSLFVSTVESFIPHKNVTIRPRDLG